MPSAWWQDPDDPNSSQNYGVPGAGQLQPQDAQQTWQAFPRKR